MICVFFMRVLPGERPPGTRSPVRLEVKHHGRGAESKHDFGL
jgi:hypothetical protein